MLAATIHHVVLVTVTYAKRWHLLQVVLDSAFACGIRHCIVVNNGSHDDLTKACFDRFGNSVRIVDLKYNAGSALGFKTGIEAALSENAEFIMLVDDDNALESGTISRLIDAHHQEFPRTRDGLLAVIGFRPEHQIEIAAGRKHDPLHKNAFLGFHLKHFWRKATRILGKQTNTRSASIPATAVLDTAPYGGMFFHRSLVESIGLPNVEFVLYADDTEFSYRITRRGGRLLLVTDAKIIDIQSSWNTSSQYKSAFHSWINGRSDLAVFYAARNRSCFECFYVEHSRFIRATNRAAFFFILALVALSEKNWRRFLLLREAIVDGESNRLGIRPGLELN